MGHTLPYKMAPLALQSEGFKHKKATVYHNQRLFLINKAEVVLPVPTGEEGLPVVDSH